MIASLLKLNEDWESHGDMRLYFTKVYSIWYSWPLCPVWVMRMVKPWSEYKEEQIGQMMIYTDSLVGAVTSLCSTSGSKWRLQWERQKGWILALVLLPTHFLRSCLTSLYLFSLHGALTTYLSRFCENEMSKCCDKFKAVNVLLLVYF